MEVNYKEYAEEKKKFLNSIGNWNCETSSMDKYGTYHKTYCGEKGTWWEVIQTVTHTAEAEVELHGKKIKISQEVEFTEVKYWNTKDSKSKYYYELIK